MRICLRLDLPASQHITLLQDDGSEAAAQGRHSVALSLFDGAMGFQDRAALHESKAQACHA